MIRNAEITSTKEFYKLVNEKILSGIIFYHSEILTVEKKNFPTIQNWIVTRVILKAKQKSFLKFRLSVY